MPLMGEDRSSEAATRRQRVTVAQASEILGVTVEAVRGRIKRGTLDHERHSGTVYVLLDADQTPTGLQPDDDQTTDQSRPAGRGEIEDELRDRIRYLERQVEEERDARRRADLLLSQLMDRVPQLEAPSEARESPVSPGPGDTPTPPPGEAHVAAERLQTSSSPAGGERPPWWRRILGG